MKSLIVIISVLFFSIASADEFDTYVDIAQKNSPQLNAVLKSYEKTNSMVEGASSLPDPMIKVAYSPMPIETKNGSQSGAVGISQMLPWFGTLSNMESSKRKMAESEYYRYLDAKESLKRDVKVSLVELYTLGKVLDKKRKLIESLHKIYELKKASFSSSSEGLVAVLEAKNKINEVANDTMILHNSLRDAQEKIGYLLNEKTDIVLPEKLPDVVTPSQVPIFENHPMIQAIDASIESVSFYKTVADKKSMPSFLVGVNYLFVDDNSVSPNSGKDALAASVGVTIPLFRAKYNADITSTSIKIEELLKLKEDKIAALQYKYQSSLLTIDNQDNQITLYDELIKSKSSQIEILNRSMSSSLVDFERILDFVDKKISYEIKKINALSVKQKSLYELGYLQSSSKNSDEIAKNEGAQNEINR